MRPTVTVALLLATVLAVPARAEEPSATLPPGPPPVRAVRATGPITIDGVLDEAAWQAAPPAGDFRQQRPNEGAAPTQRTEVRVLYDNDALYVGARMHDAHADSIVRQLARRDNGMRSDAFRLHLDPYHDGRSGYYFGISSAGTLLDGTMQNDGWSSGSWDGVWQGRAKVDGEGWTAELKIPFSQLRFARADEQVWGVNFQRSLGRGFEDDYLVYPPTNQTAFVSLFPPLVGLSGISPGHSIELLPYATGKGEFLVHDPQDPFHDGSRYTPNAGVDLRMPLGSRLTLNATANPDFGQVEVDPAVVNLSDVETFYPERRPFFVEGNSIFSAGQQGGTDYWDVGLPEPTFFYSRRIGRAPQGSVPDDAVFADVPHGTTILGAAKVTGKLGSSVNFGTLHAVTGREQADLQYGDRSRVNGFEVEPLTYYGVARALKEFPGRRHGIGVITTLTERSFQDSRLEDEFNRSSLLAVVDGWHFFDREQSWVLSGWMGGTNVTGNTTHLSALQQSSRHYFQRPDAEAFSLDPDATSMSGMGGKVWLAKQKGNWVSNSSLGFLSPGLEMGDLGYLSYSDLISGHTGVGYRWLTPTHNVKQHSVTAAAFGGTNFDGDLVQAGASANAHYWFSNNWLFDGTAAYRPQTVNARRSRGGPLMLSEPMYSLDLFSDTDGSRVRYYSLECHYYTQPDEGSWSWSIYPFASWKPAPNVQLMLGPSFERSRDGAYYLTSLDDPAATATFGRRYLFARLDQATVAANLRVNISFTPTMSLQFYGQPLVSTGRYRNVRELARAHSLDFVGPGGAAWTYDPATNLFDPDGVGGSEAFSPDFNFRSLRGNAVFRWEYRPGSTFYLVWTQDRTDQAAMSDLDIGPSFHDLIRADANNIFLAKATWYLSL